VEIGDLVEVIQDLPDWDWLSFKTGDIGIIVDIRDYGSLYDYRIFRVFIVSRQRIESIPETYLAPTGTE